jgi:hypothetical protein
LETKKQAAGRRQCIRDEISMIESVARLLHNLADDLDRVAGDIVPDSDPYVLLGVGVEPNPDPAKTVRFIGETLLTCVERVFYFAHVVGIRTEQSTDVAAEQPVAAE